MPLEQADYIWELNETNPVGSTDLVSEGDDHLRMIKRALKNSFPAVEGVVSSSDAELNHLGGVTGTTGSGKLVLDDAPTITGLVAEGLTATGDVKINGVSTDDYARLSGLNEFSAQSALVGTYFDNTRVRRGDNVGMLHLLGGQSAIAASGARVTLYGSDYAGSAAGDASIVAGSGGSISLSASAGDITLNNISYTDFARLSQPAVFRQNFLVQTSSDARLGLFSSSDGRGLLFRSGTNQYIYSSVDGTTVSGATVLLAYNSVSDQMTLGSGASGARVQMRSAGGLLYNTSAANSGGRITLSSSEATTAAQVGAPGDMRFVYQ